jgi:hypothetical protein
MTQAQGKYLTWMGKMLDWYVHLLEQDDHESHQILQKIRPTSPRPPTENSANWIGM